VRTAYKEVLNNSTIVQNILGFVGPGQHLYIATINRLFKQYYEQVDSNEVEGFDKKGTCKRIVVGAHVTRLSEVCRSWARIAEAADIGVPVLAKRSFLQKVAADLVGHEVIAKPGFQLDINTHHCQVFMGQCADHELLSLAFDKLGMSNNGSVTFGAVCAGRAATLQWLIKERHSPLYVTISSYAAARGHLDVLIYLHKIKFQFDPETSMRAALNGHLHILQFLHGNGYQWHADTCRVAIHGGHLSVLQWLYEHGCPRDASAMKKATAAVGNINIMDWLLQRDGAELPELVMCTAAFHGQLTMCEYLLDKRCPLASRVCTHAAQGGQLNVLIWLRQHGCPWNDLAVVWLSAHSGSIDTMAYILQHTTFLHDVTLRMMSDMLRTAGALGHLAVAQWLRDERGAPWPTYLSCMIAGESKQWSGEVLAWARANGCTSKLDIV
jgi:hypothetical protein